MWGPSGLVREVPMEERVQRHLRRCDICANAVMFCAEANDGGLLALLGLWKKFESELADDERPSRHEEEIR